MIIQSLLDTDLYKFTMQQAVWSRFPQATAEYAFKCRDSSVNLSPFAGEIREEIGRLCELSLTDQEQEYLKGIRYIKPGYVDSLRNLTLKPEAVEISTDPEFRLRISGNWYQTILFEVPVLAIVNEVYFRNTHPNAFRESPEGYDRLHRKCEQILQSPAPLRIVEFGTRRRYSREWQEIVVRTLQQQVPNALSGTSNVHLARTLGLKPFGTMAHEFLQAGQAFTHAADSQRFALEHWMFDGARHDSGDPFEWGEKLIAHYQRLGIDARSKTAVFSDSLDIPKATALAQQFEGRIRTLFGIGTNLTNDLGFKPLPIVLKMVRCNGRPVAKISDSPGKAMNEDPVYLAYLRSVFQVT